MMKKLMITIVLLSAGISVNGMFEGGRPTDEYRKQLEKAQRTFLKSPVRTTPQQFSMIADSMAPNGSQTRVFHARDVNGFNILHHLAAKGANHDTPAVKFLKDKGVSQEGIALEGGAMSPSFDEVLECYEKGEYADGPPEVVLASDVRRTLEFDDADDSAEDRSWLEENESDEVDSVILSDAVARRVEGEFFELIQSAIGRDITDELIPFLEKNDCDVDTVRIGDQALGLQALGDWLEKANKAKPCPRVLAIVALYRSNTDKQLRDLVYGCLRYGMNLQALELYFAGVGPEGGNVDTILMDTIPGDFTIRTWLEHLVANPSVSKGMPLEAVLGVINQNRPKAEVVPADDPVADDAELKASGSSKFLQYTFWTTVAAIASGLVYKKYFMSDDRSHNGRPVEVN